MTIEKRQSGKYRIKQMVDGVIYSVTLDYKPSKLEANQIISDYIKKHSQRIVGTATTIQEACEDYINSKKQILSPTTISSYHSIVRNLPDIFLKTRLNIITTLTIQAQINDYSIGRSPKSVRNMANFLLAVFKAHNIVIGNIQLPQKEKQSIYIPTKDDIRMIINEVTGTRYEVPIKLAIFGLRRSETCALELSDLNGRTLTINKALVQNEQNEWIIKTTKTTESTREIIIPQELADLIRKQGFIFDGAPDTIYVALRRIQNKLGLAHFSLHKLRHFFASYLHDLGYSDKQIQEMGGWRTSNVLQTVYQHALDMQQAKEKAADDFNSLM